MWKGRFPWLRSIRMKIKQDKKYMQRIIRMIAVTAILHNFLIEESDLFEDSWYSLDSLPDFDEADEPGDELNQPAHLHSNLRRNQLLNYFNENNLL
jgi:hypothetical protein